MNSILEYLFLGMIFFGLFFVLTAALGIFRFKDVYTRLHASSKGATFGFIFIVLGASFLMGGEKENMKAIVAVLFQLLTAPIGAHLIARVGLKKGLRPRKNPKGELLECAEPVEEST